MARGNIIKANGDNTELDHFADKLSLVFWHIEMYNSLHLNQHERILDGEVQEEKPASKNGDDILVYGPGGNKVTARTANQKRMVVACDNNDMVFAIGPAGTGKSYTAVALAVRALKEKQVKTIKSNNKKGKQATIGESDVKDQTGSDSLFNIPLDEQPKNQSNFYLSF